MGFLAKEIAVSAVPVEEVLEVGVQHSLTARGTDVTVEEWSDLDQAFYPSGVVIAGEERTFINSSSVEGVRFTGAGSGSLVIVRTRTEVI